MSLPRLRSVVGWFRLVTLVVMVLTLLSVDLTRAATTFAKEIDIIGTVDCGLPSGKRCDIGDTLTLRTDNLTGELAPALIDVSWIKGKLPGLDQDDELTLAVELLPGGKLRALSIISAKKRTGTLNEGLTTGSREVSESRRDRGEKQDEDSPSNSSVPGPGGIAGTVTNLLTGAPIVGATVRVAGFIALTDGSGNYRISGIEAGVFTLDVTAPLFSPFSQTVTVPAEGTVTVNVQLRPLPGVLTGVVSSLLTGAPIPGATVSVLGTSFSATTNVAGSYSIAGIPPGTYQVQASAPGFTTQTQTVVIQATNSAQASFQLATAFPNIAITLVWGAQPTDLDAHLSGPASAGGRFHVFFLNPNPETYASLTLRDDDQFGPEQVVIRPNPATGLYVPGSYHFWVHNFTGTPGFDASQGRVIVNKDTQFLGIFEVSGATGDPNSALWYVLNVEIDGAGNATLVTVQQFTNGPGSGGSFEILSPPYGSKPPQR
jgi:hypothetical protein